MKAAPMNVTAWLFGAHNVPAEVDPEILKDPVAQKTEWTPARPGGSSRVTRRLASKTQDQWHFRKSIFNWVAVALLGALGVGPVLLGLGFGSLPLMAVGGLFIAATAFFLFLDRQQTTIDLAQRSVQIGAGDDVRSVPFDEVHALQLISERIESSRSVFLSHELNLVLKSGERINLVDHGSIGILRKDTRRLAQLVDKPIWDHAAARRPDLRIR